MRERLILPETARLAQEKGLIRHLNMSGELLGYDLTGNYPDTPTYYCVYNWLPNKEDFLYAPTQALLQKWLREEHNIIVLVDDECSNSVWAFSVKTKKTNNHFCDKSYETYEDALEAGLQEALNIIKIE